MEEFYIITYRNKPLRFASYCVATEVSDYSRATIYHKPSDVKRRLQENFYIKNKLVKGKTLKVKKVHTEVKWIDDLFFDFKVKMKNV